MRIRTLIAGGVTGISLIVGGAVAVTIMGSTIGGGTSASASTCTSVSAVPASVQIDGVSYARINANWETYTNAAAAVTVDNQSHPVPPELLAALHFRIAGNDSTRDLQTGDPLGSGSTPSPVYNKYGRPTTLLQSATEAGEALQEYSFQSTKHWIDAVSPSPVAVGEAVYTYGGRATYYDQVAKDRGFSTEPWRGSPFVVNLYDDKAKNMVLLDDVTGQPGRIDTTPGVVTVFNELRSAKTGSPGTSSTNVPTSIPTSYASIFTTAATAEGTNPSDLAAIFVTEHGNNWPNPSGPWASSGTGAQGPFQFEPGTWPTYATDGNGDGKADVENLDDAAFSAAKMLHALGVTPTTALGEITHPWVPGTFMYAAGAYNAGGGTLTQYTNPSDPLGAPGLASLPDGGHQVENYVANVYYLVSTDFAHGNPGYGNPQGTVVNNSGTSGNTQINTSQTGCSPSGSSAASTGAYGTQIADLAEQLSWADYSHGTTPKPGTASQPGYIDLLNKYDHGGPSGLNGADCGAFVATVIHAVGADPDYPDYTTGVQTKYMLDHATTPTAHTHMVYQQVANLKDPSNLQPGDIFIVGGINGTGGEGHTYIYVGPAGSSKNIAEASQGTDEPYLNKVMFLDSLGRGTYSIFRIVKQS